MPDPAARRAARWGGWTIACLLVLIGGWVTGYHLVTGIGLAASLLCASRWIEASRTAREEESVDEEAGPDADAPRPPSNVIRFRRPED